MKEGGQEEKDEVTKEHLFRTKFFGVGDKLIS